MFTEDLDICYLDADVPSGVPFYTILPSDYRRFIDPVGTPVVITNHDEEALVGEIVNPHLLVTFINGEGAEDTAFVADIRESSGDREDYWENITAGYSGHPTFITVNGNLILFGIHFGTNVGGTRLYDTNIYTWRHEINVHMAVVTPSGDTAYQLTTFDLWGFAACHIGMEAVISNRGTALRGNISNRGVPLTAEVSGQSVMTANVRSAA